MKQHGSGMSTTEVMGDSNLKLELTRMSWNEVQQQPREV